MKKNVIAEADEQVGIVTVCQLLGVDLPDDVGSGRSRKVHCPFGQIYHSDGGTDPAMRIYPASNSAYCFSCQAYFTPVGLASQAMGIDRRTAAIRLLDHIGHKPLSLAAAWQQASTFEPEPDKALLADALKTFCRRVDKGWNSRQFDPDVAAALTRCLSVLDLVRTPEDVNLWLTRCKAAMRQVLNCPEPSLSEKYQVLLRGMNLDRKE